MISRRLILGVGLGLLLMGWRPNLAQAQAQSVPAPDTPATLKVSGGCPSAETIWADVRAIVPASDLGRVTTARVEVSDLGATYQVRIASEDGERHRTFRDVEHDCDHRARFAAVFIVVTLLPPDVLLEAPAAVAPTPVPATTALPTTIVAVALVHAAPPPIHLRVELAALFDGAPGAGGGGESTTLGGEVRSYWGARRLTAVAAVGLEPRASFTFGGVGVDELRVPLDVGAAFVRPWDRLAVVGELGLAGALLRISGNNTASTQSGTRLDLGGRIGVAVRFGSPTSGVIPVVGLHALVFPKPYEATAKPEGNIGQLPALWLGATMGISFAR
jgi:hypothetical protein